MRSTFSAGRRVVSDFSLPVFRFVFDPHTSVRLHINIMELNFQLFSGNVAIIFIVRTVTSHNKITMCNYCKIRTSSLALYHPVMSISKI